MAAGTGPWWPRCPQEYSLVVTQREVGVPHRVVHAAAHQLPGLVHSHPGHLVCVALSRKGVVLTCLGIPVMWAWLRKSRMS